MKKNIAIVLFLFFSFSLHSQIVKNKVKQKKIAVTSKGYLRCATVENETLLKRKNPKRLSIQQYEAWLNPLLKEYNTAVNRSETGGIITIPVVVHVIHNGDAYGSDENITDEQVQSQITVMNQDFRKMTGTPGFGLGVDTQIQFALAKSDPNGNPTNGIDRVNLCRRDWNSDSSSAIINLVDTEVKPQTIWNTNQYLNMWCINFGDSDLLGYAQFPDGSGLPGLDSSGGEANTDGVVSNYGTFGSRSIYPSGNYIGTQYDKGRTMTHEVGHWLGLRHIWGEDGAGGCDADDYCNDTPNTSGPNGGCPTGADSCPSPGLDMIENYMEYTDDSCMNIFTADQKARMIVIMNNANRRVSLKSSTKDLPISLFANDAEIIIENYCSVSVENQCNVTASGSHKILLYNRGTSNLTAATINYNVDSGLSQEYLWTGNLNPQQYAEIEIITIETSGIFTAFITNVNGVLDQRISNNSKSKSFSFIPSTDIPSYDIGKVVFRLHTDQFGTETTWELKDQNGTIVYQGGPYDDLGDGEIAPLITDTWTLSQNNCYSFTIYDSFGDGICCAYGNGYYSIKSSSGLITIASENNFENFSNQAFKTGDFNPSASDDLIFIFPNPVNETVSLKISETLGIPSSYEIYNNLGQKMKSSETITGQELDIDASYLVKGIYFIKVYFKTKTKTIRFIKN